MTYYVSVFVRITYEETCNVSSLFKEINIRQRPYLDVKINRMYASDSLSINKFVPHLIEQHLPEQRVILKMIYNARAHLQTKF